MDSHIPLEVADVDEALRFYGAVFAFDQAASTKATMAELRWRFLTWATSPTRSRRGTGSPDQGRHFGLVVDDRSNVMALAVSRAMYVSCLAQPAYRGTARGRSG
jgi:catechol 2,3-dioxygenase-like lactoylglutathione lyase family enzyme